MQKEHSCLIAGLRWVSFISGGFAVCCLILAEYEGSRVHSPRDGFSVGCASIAGGTVQETALTSSYEPGRIKEQVQAGAADLSQSDGTETGVLTATSPEPEGEIEKIEFLNKVRKWAESVPSEAAAWAEGLQNSDQRREALEQVALAWPAIDLPGSVAWFNALPDDPAKLAVGVALACEIARAEPLTAVDLLARMPEHPERDRALEHSVSEWAFLDFEAASKWAMELEKGGLRSKLLAAVAIAGAEADSFLAAEFASRRIEAGEEQNRAAIAIVQRWSQSSPDEASAWIAGFPTSDLRENATQTLASITDLANHSSAEETGN